MPQSEAHHPERMMWPAAVGRPRPRRLFLRGHRARRCRAVGNLVGKFTKHKIDSGISEKLGAALPPGSAGIVAIYDRTKTDTVNSTLVSAVLKSAAQIDGGGAKDLKAALAEAQGGVGG